MQILTVTPNSNDIKVDLIRKGHNRVTGVVCKQDRYKIVSIQFSSIKSDEKLVAIIQDAIKKCVELSQPIKIDLESENIEFLPNKAATPGKSFVEERKSEERQKKYNHISKAQQWDNMYNEGGEGYNPYRY